MDYHDRISTPGGLGVLLGLLVVGVCYSAAAVAQQPKESRMWMTVNEHRFAISLADNGTARAFARQLPLTLHMEELNGNEKYAKLPAALPVDASRPGVIREGDLMLYGADTLVVFYATFHSTYSYTRIGHVDDTANLAPAVVLDVVAGGARITGSRRYQRVVSNAKLAATQKTGLLRGGRAGEIFFTDTASLNAKRAQQRLGLDGPLRDQRIEFQIIKEVRVNGPRTAPRGRSRTLGGGREF